MSSPGTDATGDTSKPAPIPITYSHSESLIEILGSIRSSLLLSTYQAGKLVTVGVSGGALNVTIHHFERAMGIATSPGGISVGAGPQVWYLQSMPEIGPRMLPPGKYDGCYLARSSHVTGEINSHEMAYGGGRLWIVNTLFSCLCTLHPTLSFLPKWKPSFVSSVAAEDRCHLNGMAMENGQPRFVTALGETDSPQGWRHDKAAGGCLIDVPRNVVVTRGFSMPHSPRLYHGRVWLLESGTGRLLNVDPASGRIDVVSADLPGYARGFSISEPYAFVALSRMRATSTYEDLSIAARRESLRCGFVVIELASGRTVAEFEFTEGIRELFAVEVLRGCRCPGISGPFIVKDNTQPLYTIPDEWVTGRAPRQIPH